MKSEKQMIQVGCEGIISESIQVDCQQYYPVLMLSRFCSLEWPYRGLGLGFSNV